jgi:hypothetical protein
VVRPMRMKKTVTRNQLRNRIIERVNNWPMLNTHLISAARFFGTKTESPKNKGFSRFAIGVKEGGKMVLIYPYKEKSSALPINVCEIMCSWENLGGIVGCAVDALDAFDICYDQESEYKRKKRTYAHRDRLNNRKKSEEEE